MERNLRSKAGLAAALKKRSRYRADRVAEETRKTKADLFQTFMAAGATALVAALVIGSLSLAGVISMAPAFILLIVAWLVTVLAAALPSQDGNGLRLIDCYMGSGCRQQLPLSLREWLDMNI